MQIEDLVTIEKYLASFVEDFKKQFFIMTNTDDIYSRYRLFCMLYCINKNNVNDHFIAGGVSYFNEKGFDCYDRDTFYYDCKKNKFKTMIQDYIYLDRFEPRYTKSFMEKVIDNNSDKKYNVIVKEDLIEEILADYRMEINKMITQDKDISHLFNLQLIGDNLFKDFNFYVKIENCSIFNDFYKDYILGTSYDIEFIINISNKPDIVKDLIEYIKHESDKAENFFSKNLKSLKFLFIDYEYYDWYYMDKNSKYYRRYIVRFMFHTKKLNQLLHFALADYLRKYL